MIVLELLVLLTLLWLYSYFLKIFWGEKWPYPLVSFDNLSEYFLPSEFFWFHYFLLIYLLSIFSFHLSRVLRSFSLQALLVQLRLINPSIQSVIFSSVQISKKGNYGNFRNFEYYTFKTFVTSKNLVISKISIAAFFEISEISSLSGMFQNTLLWVYMFL